MTTLGVGIHKAQVERALLTTLTAALPEYLKQMETEQALATGALPAPRSWAIVNDLDFWPEDQLPAGLVFSPGLARAPERIGDGIHAAWWAAAVAIKVYGRDYEEASRYASLYGLAVRRVATQRATLGGLADAVVWADESYDDLGAGERHRNLAAAVLSFEIFTSAAIDASAGPPEPAAVPSAPWPSDPTVTQTRVTLEPVQADEELPE